MNSVRWGFDLSFDSGSVRVHSPIVELLSVDAVYCCDAVVESA